MAKEISHLAVFDIDGTLVRSGRVDGLCFREAHGEQFGHEALPDNWHGFTHMTDSCINHELFRDLRGRPPTAAEIRRLQDRFLASLRARHAESAGYFEPVPGSPAILDRLRELDGWAVALASGGWRRSAHFKLSCIGVDAARLPGAFGDDHMSREGIVAKAIDRAQESHGVEGFDRVVSIGDAVWDVKTARNLDLPFIGIAGGDREIEIREAGARHVLADFSDPPAFFEMLVRAAAP